MTRFRAVLGTLLGALLVGASSVVSAQTYVQTFVTPGGVNTLSTITLTTNTGPRTTDIQYGVYSWNTSTQSLGARLGFITLPGNAVASYFGFQIAALPGSTFAFAETGGTLAFDPGALYGGDVFACASTCTPQASTPTHFDGFSVDFTTIPSSTVPEPQTLGLFAAGAAALLLLRRRLASFT